jgi:hypothetical protein
LGCVERLAGGARGVDLPLAFDVVSEVVGVVADGDADGAEGLDEDDVGEEVGV